MTSPHRIAFIGLGAMGYPMAGHLARAGHDVTVFNRTTARAEAWQREYGGHVAPTPAAAAKDQDAVMLCVGNDDDVREVTLGERGALSSMREGALLVDHTTTSEALATSLAASASQSGVAFLDAPVSGGQIGAENGALTVMVGADEQAVSGAQPLIESYAKSVRRMGPVAPGSSPKWSTRSASRGCCKD